MPEVRVEDNYVTRKASYELLPGIVPIGLREPFRNRTPGDMGRGDDPRRAVVSREVIEHPNCRDRLRLHDCLWRGSIRVKALLSTAWQRFTSMNSHIERRPEQTDHEVLKRFGFDECQPPIGMSVTSMSTCSVCPAPSVVNAARRQSILVVLSTPRSTQ